MSITRQLTLFLALLVIGVVCGGLPLPGVVGPSEALAQQFREPYRFTTRNNSTAASIAIYLKQLHDGSTSSSTTSGGSGSSPAGIYTATTIGNMNEITTILEQGAEGYVSIDTSQDGSGSSQSASVEGTQVFGETKVYEGDTTGDSTHHDDGDHHD